ncbi:MAG: hypothetical protein ACR2K3_05180 [Nocardioides sp.]
MEGADNRRVQIGRVGYVEHDGTGYLYGAVRAGQRAAREVLEQL